jgi:hypothetical protein
VPEVITKLSELKLAAETALTSFLANYDRLVQASVHNDVGQFGREIEFPKSWDVQDSFGARISPPEPLNVADMARFGSLPAGMAQEIADANNAKLAKQLEGAKEAAIHEAQEQMELVAKQLGEGKRLHESLIENSRRVAQLLRDMVMGFDNDPRLIELANLIDEKISSGIIETWRNSEHSRKEPIRAANTVVKGIKAIKKAAPKKASPIMPVAQTGSTLAGGGLMADLLD